MTLIAKIAIGILVMIGAAGVAIFAGAVIAFCITDLRGHRSRRLPWHCMLTGDDCYHPNEDCSRCPVFKGYERERMEDDGCEDFDD